MDLLVKLHATFLCPCRIHQQSWRKWWLLLFLIWGLNVSSNSLIISEISAPHVSHQIRVESPTLLAKLLATKLLIVWLFYSWSWSNAIIENTLLVFLSFQTHHYEQFLIPSNQKCECCVTKHNGSDQGKFNPSFIEASCNFKKRAHTVTQMA